MIENYKKLKERILFSINNSNLDNIFEILSNIKDNTLVSGVGGSSVVSLYLSKVLEAKNNIIATNVTHRDLNYINKNNYKNIIVVSYKGINHGVDVALNNKLNKYLFSSGTKENINNIKYNIDEIEKSFIALSQTLIPMTLSLLYYLDNNKDLILNILNLEKEFIIGDSNIYEILSGYETSTASKFIESTLTESGIAIPIVHDKYDYCHGRSTLNYNYNANIIFFNNNTELDNLYNEQLPKYYKSIIKLDKMFNDNIINDYYLTYISMLLCRDIAEKYNKDLSEVEYSPIVKKLYKYKGDM